MAEEGHPQQRQPLLRKKLFERSASHADDELRSFRSCLRYLCVDQSTTCTSVISWTLFVLLTFAVPLLSHFVLACSECNSAHKKPYGTVTQLSLTVIATLSFLCLSSFVRKYSLRRFLFLDKLCGESEKVRLGYMAQLNRSFRLLSVFVLPCFFAESAYKIWWYCSGGSRIPFLGNVYASDTIACILELCSWVYRTSIFFLVCVLFRLICHLQILRLQDFAEVFNEESDVSSILREHLKVKRQLRVISHRFRVFIVSALIFVTASQFASLLITTNPHANVNIFKTGELALCSVTLVTGLLMCLRSATKITHKAQAITSFAAKWHVCSTIDSFDSIEEDVETPVHPSYQHVFPVEVDSDHEPTDEDEDDGSMSAMRPLVSTISFQKRQALGERLLFCASQARVSQFHVELFSLSLLVDLYVLTILCCFDAVTYLENNRAGISVFGIMLDRTYLHTIFGIELSLVLWLLGKTVGIN